MDSRPPQFDWAAIEQAIHEIAAHPCVGWVGEPQVLDGLARAEFDVTLTFGSRWRARGESPTGVLPVERVRIDFPSEFPLAPPEMSLRSDFGRNHPHIQPWRTKDGRVVPCVVDGRLSEFFTERGAYGLVEQLVPWLNRAAQGQLIDPEHGWEPMRRDGCNDTLIANREELYALVSKGGGFKFLRCDYLCDAADEQLPDYFHGQIGEVTKLRDAPFQRLALAASQHWQGRGVAITVWAGKRADGSPIIDSDYRPDAVQDAESLFELARALDADAALRTAMNLIWGAGQVDEHVLHPLPVVFLVRRPYPLQGSDSHIEICSYLASLNFKTRKLCGPARALGHRDAIHPALLASMSGTAPIGDWLLLGCGSLGSKIAMHAARSGAAPSLVADRASLSPHNAARYGTHPIDTEFQLSWIGPKAENLSTVIAGLGQKAVPFFGDHLDLFRKIDESRPLQKSRFLLNSTASLAVRETMSRPEAGRVPRVVETSLYGEGKLGLMTIEGESRNPNSVELIASVYDLAASDSDVAVSLFDPTSLTRATVGQGCDSLTMRMSDATLSVLAGAFYELLPGATASPEGGLHFLVRDGAAMEHHLISIAPFQRIGVEGMESWTLCISPTVDDQIAAEIAQSANTETGGVLVGFVSKIGRCAVVTRLLSAPPDSSRSKTRFVLGTDGLAAQLADISDRSEGALTCIGTWHSHLGKSEPSQIDRSTAKLIAAGTMNPTVLLIRGTDGYRALSASSEARETNQGRERVA